MSEIQIKGLKIFTHIGVPDEERATAQQIEVDVLVDTRRSFSKMNDDLSMTVDYVDMCNQITALANERPRKLIETLADEIAAMLLSKFRINSATVEIRKFIVPNTQFVSVRTLTIRK